MVQKPWRFFFTFFYFLRSPFELKPSQDCFFGMFNGLTHKLWQSFDLYQCCIGPLIRRFHGSQGDLADPNFTFVSCWVKNSRIQVRNNCHHIVMCFLMLFNNNNKLHLYSALWIKDSSRRFTKINITLIKFHALKIYSIINHFHIIHLKSLMHCNNNNNTRINQIKPDQS